MIRNLKGQFDIIDISGIKINMLTVVCKSRQHNNGAWYWKCLCDCGNETEVSIQHLTTGRITKSCGCIKRNKEANKKHGLKYHPLYKVWNNMKGRCLNKNYSNYPNYGGRGIAVCDEWVLSVVNFYNDMIDGYEKGKHLGRIDNNGNYCKYNCRWETPIQNMNNKRSNVYICIDGRTHTPAEWARQTDQKDNTISNRKRKGATDYESVFGLK